MREITYKMAVDLFLIDKQADGVSAGTIQGYAAHMRNAWERYIDRNEPIANITTTDLKLIVAEMAETGLSRNSIRSYTATMQSFLKWARAEGLCDAEIRLFKGEETVPECYSPDELRRLLKRPNLRRCSFVEYRSWVIVNLLVNNGCRASSVRAMQLRDVDLERGVIYLRHTKRRKAEMLPLGDYMVQILSQYLEIRKGKDTDPLFPTEDGSAMTETCLRQSINRFNASRGVERTGLHKFRHTFARMYLLDCGGDPLRLQKLLGHSTLAMTKHYARIYDAEIVEDFRNHSPLDKLRNDKIKMPPPGIREKTEENLMPGSGLKCRQGGTGRNLFTF